MKRILRAIDRKIAAVRCSEEHERHDGELQEADRLMVRIENLKALKEYAERIK